MNYGYTPEFLKNELKEPKYQHKCDECGCHNWKVFRDDRNNDGSGFVTFECACVHTYPDSDETFFCEAHEKEYYE